METESYNKQYYQKNKDKIKAQIFKKEACPFCSREVAHQNMPRHKQSALCKNNRNKPASNEVVDLVQQLKAQLEQLQLERRAA